MKDAKKCPTCGKPWQPWQPSPPAKPVRICSKCKKPIGKSHKWRWTRKKGVSTIEHRHCDDPISYLPRDA